MELIEQDEMADFHAILKSHEIDVAEFLFLEIDVTDPKSDEIYPLQGSLTVTRKSSGRWKQYPIGDGTAWVKFFRRDLDRGAFA